jgi:phosphonatase-like hydrolase
MNTKLVVFDLAGTTVADNGNVNDSFRNVFLSAGIQVPAAEVDQLMGYRKIEAITLIVDKYLPDNSDNQALINKLHDDFNEDMTAFYLNDPEIKPLPHAEDIFEWLNQNGIKVGLNTGFTRRITDAILQRLGWDQDPFVNMVVCSDEVPEGRPKPFMIQKMLEKFNISSPQQVIKVGDTEVDVLEGRKAGCGLVVSVTTGSYTREQLKMYNPDFIIDSLLELHAIIK